MNIKKENKSYIIEKNIMNEVLGKIKPKELINISSRPGVGKTTLIIKIIIDILNNSDNVILYNSLEMSKNSLQEKINSIKKFDKENISNRLIITENISTIDKLNEYISMNPSIKFIFIDYIQLMNHKNINIIEKLRQLAVKNNIVIVFANQLSVNGETSILNSDLISNKLIYLHNPKKIGNKKIIDIRVINNEAKNEKFCHLALY